jgi:PfaD family protein
MANGITSEQMVAAMANAGMIGFFGSAGLDLQRIEAAIDRLKTNLGDLPFGVNLIHSPSDPALEEATVDLYLRRNIRLISASAYLDLTLPLVRYRVIGIYKDDRGRVVTPNKIMAKVSRVEVARKFCSPPPDKMLAELVQRGDITREQAQLAAKIPMAEDITAEADSGGHTDNRPALALLPTMLALRDAIQAEYGYAEPIRIGAGGGIATPSSAAAAFGMGAAYVMTGTVNQSCVEAGTSELVRKLLAQASQADVVMAPAADMFEMGVKVQVLKWGTMFAVKARKLYELYRAHSSLESIPADQRTMLEKNYFKASLDQVWQQVQDYFAPRDAAQIARAEQDPKHKMALVFRAYLGQTSRWAIDGDPQRKADYQVWCGPAMGAFNEWVKDTFLSVPEQRDVVSVAMNLLVGAAVLSRANWLRGQGLVLPAAAQRFQPRETAALNTLLE